MTLLRPTPLAGEASENNLVSLLAGYPQPETFNFHTGAWVLVPAQINFYYKSYETSCQLQPNSQSKNSYDNGCLTSFASLLRSSFLDVTQRDAQITAAK